MTLAVTAVAALGTTAIAFGDNLANRLDSSLDADRETVVLANGASATVPIKLEKDNPQDSCNLSGNETVIFSVTSDNNNVQVSPRSLTYTSCNNIDVTVTRSGSGVANITFAKTGGTTPDTDSYNPSGADFRVTEPAVTASNSAPTVSAFAPNPSGNEGATLSTNGAFADSDGDTLTITKHSGAGTVTPGTSGAWSWSLGTGDQTSGTVVVKAQDGRGGEVTDTFDYSAVNVAPTVATPASDVTVDEGQNASASGQFNDVSGDLPLTRSILEVLAAGTGTAPGTFALPSTDDGKSWTWGMSTTDNFVKTLRVSANDGDGGVTNDEFTVTVNNVAPVLANVAVTGNCTPAVGGSFSDAGSADTHLGYVNWDYVAGDATKGGRGDQLFSASAFSQTASSAYTGSGSRDVMVTLVDDDGGEDSEVITHQLKNNPSEVLSPMNKAGTTRSVFKAGSTIPVKITVKDCGGANVSTLHPSVALTKVDSSSLDELTESSVNEVATNGKDMRWDASAQQYVYNLSSKLSQHTGAALGAGTYKVTITDGTFANSAIAYFDIKK